MFGLQTRPNRAVRLLLGWQGILSADVLVHFILSVQLDYNANDSKTIDREVHIVLDSDTVVHHCNGSEKRVDFQLYYKRFHK